MPSIYGIVRDILMVVSFAILFFYYPFKTFLSAWLPDYAESLMYMALLFPMVIYEGKTALLINTYLKSLRKEKLMLKINIASLGLSLIMTLLSTAVLKNLNLAVLTIVLLQAFRAVYAEKYLSKILNISVDNDIALELVLTLIFILSGWYLNSWYTVLVYGLAYIVYLLIKRNELGRTINELKVLFKT